MAYTVRKDFFLVMRTFRVYSLSSFQICCTILLTVATMLYFISPQLNYFVTGSVYCIFFTFTPFFCPLTPMSDNHQSSLYL